MPRPSWASRTWFDAPCALPGPSLLAYRGEGMKQRLRRKAVTLQPKARAAAPPYPLRGSGCRAATTPPRAAAERLAHAAWFAESLCAAARGATPRRATSFTTLTRYAQGRFPTGGEDGYHSRVQVSLLTFRSRWTV